MKNWLLTIKESTDSSNSILCAIVFVWVCVLLFFYTQLFYCLDAIKHIFVSAFISSMSYKSFLCHQTGQIFHWWILQLAANCVFHEHKLTEGNQVTLHLAICWGSGNILDSYYYSVLLMSGEQSALCFPYIENKPSVFGQESVVWNKGYK